METNKPLEQRDTWTSVETWNPLSITDYVQNRIGYDWFNDKSTLSIEEKIDRITEVFANLMEKLYNTRIINLKDIDNIVGSLPPDVRRKKVE